jgi:3'-phosphoadenosine 5'-phosphosulfate sulfotransferase (PAPS reductase)/FAD synthetase
VSGQRYIVQFSGGLGSWGSARFLRDALGIEPERMTLLFADTNGEDPDLYRFLHEAAADIGAPLVVLDNDGRTIWDAFREARMIGNTRLSVCSRMLKQKPCRDWLTENTDPADTTVVVGIDWTEVHRLPAIERNWAPWLALAPLAEPGAYSKRDILDLLADAGIEPPRMYAQGFAHNNCAGACVRSGTGPVGTTAGRQPRAVRRRGSPGGSTAGRARQGRRDPARPPRRRDQAADPPRAEGAHRGRPADRPLRHRRLRLHDRRGASVTRLTPTSPDGSAVTTEQES